MTNKGENNYNFYKFIYGTFVTKVCQLFNFNIIIIF